MTQSPVVVNEEKEPDLQTILQERWDDLIALFFQPDPTMVKSDPSTVADAALMKLSQHQPNDDNHTLVISSDVDSDSEEGDYYDEWSEEDDETTLLGDDDTNNTVNRELDQLHFDLDITERSIADLEQEFAEDFEALAEGLETAFEYFEDDDMKLVVQATLQKQEAQMSKSTRSQFATADNDDDPLSQSIRSFLKSGLEESLRRKRKRRLSSRHRRNRATFCSAEPQHQEAKEEEIFKNWFERLWEAIERLFRLFSAEQQQKNTEAFCKTFNQLWKEI